VGAGRDDDAPSVELDATLGEERDGARIAAVLLREDAGGQRLLGVAVDDRDGGLDHDRPGVSPLVYDVHRAARDARAGLQGLTDGVHAGVGGQEGGVDIEYFILKR